MFYKTFFRFKLIQFKHKFQKCIYFVGDIDHNVFVCKCKNNTYRCLTVSFV